MLWTKKHTTYSVLHRLTPTARELWQWLLDEMPEGSHEIIDLRDFNKWVNRTRGFPHDPKTVKSAASQLREKGDSPKPKATPPTSGSGRYNRSKYSCPPSLSQRKKNRYPNR
jgi:hypothetical protein